MTTSNPDRALTVEIARNHATGAWARYASTCHLGGTTEQRAWAYEQAAEAEHQLARLQRHTAKLPRPVTGKTTR